MSFDMNINETEIDNTLLLINSSINTSFLNKIIDNNQESYVLKNIKIIKICNNYKKIIDDLEILSQQFIKEELNDNEENILLENYKTNIIKQANINGNINRLTCKFRLIINSTKKETNLKNKIIQFYRIKNYYRKLINKFKELSNSIYEIKTDINT